jgi:LPS export ABC transporter protein LptC
LNGFFVVPARGNWGLVLLAGLALVACEDKKATGPLQTYTGPLMETANVRTLFSDSAKLKLKLTAPLEQQFENGDVVYPKGMTVTFYQGDGKTIVNTLTAKYGKVDKLKSLYIMRGAVKVVNVPQQQRMNTEELFFDKGKQQIYTTPTMPVEVITPYERLEGKGLTANQDFSRYRLLTPTGSFAPPSGPQSSL